MLQKVVCVVMCWYVSTAQAADQVMGTGTVTFQAIGASGGLKLFRDSDASDFIMLQQEKLEEYTASGSPVNNKMNMAGQNEGWITPRTHTACANCAGATAGPCKCTNSSEGCSIGVCGDPNASRPSGCVDQGFSLCTGTEAVTYYETSFGKSSGGKEFALTAILARESVTAKEATACSACISVSPCTTCDCQYPGRNCTDSVVDSNGDRVCAAGSTLCTQLVVVPKDQLEFAIRIPRWDWMGTNHRLRYALQLKQKQGKALPGASAITRTQIDLGDGAYIQTPNTAKIISGKTGGNDESTNVHVSTYIQGSKYIISFDFGHFDTRELYYDPTISTPISAARGREPQTLYIALMLFVAYAASRV